MSDEPNDRVRSVSRAMRVLEEVASSSGPLTVKAIARRTRLNLSTTYHLVRTLAYENYLRRQADGRYVLGDAVALRFRDLARTFRQPPEVHAVLQHLAAVTRRTAYLGRYLNERIMVADLVEGPESPYLEDLEVGLPAAAHATAVGKALLAGMSKRRRAAYLADQGMRPFTRRTPVELGALEHELAGVRRSGEVSEHGQFRDGVSCIGALVPTTSAKEPWWTVAVSTRGEGIPVEVGFALRLACADLRGLPHRPAPVSAAPEGYLLALASRTRPEMSR